MVRQDDYMETTNTQTINDRNEFSAAEYRRRISAAARRCAEMERLRGGYRIETDIRVVPVAYPHIPTYAEAWPEGDDLYDHITPKYDVESLREAGHLQHGACIHVRISTTGRYGELVNVFVVWTGTPDCEPLIIDAPCHEADVVLVGDPYSH